MLPSVEYREIIHKFRHKWLRLPNQAQRDTHLQKIHSEILQQITQWFNSPYKVLEIYQPEVCIRSITETLTRELEETVDHFMNKYYPVWWENIPLLLRHHIYRYLKKRLPYFLDDLYDILFENADEFISLPILISDQLNRHATLAYQWMQLKSSPAKQHIWIVHQFLNPSNLFIEFFNGPRASKARFYLLEQVSIWLEDPLASSALRWSLGFTGYMHLKHQITDELLDILCRPLLSLDFQQERMERAIETIDQQ